MQLLPRHGYFYAYARRFARPFWLGIGFLFLTDLLDILPPLIIMRAINEITGSAGVAALARTALLFFAITVSLALVRFYWRMEFGKFHQNVATDLRDRIFKKLTELGPSFFHQNPVGELMSLVTNDVESVRMGMGPGLIVLSDALFYCLTIPPIMLSLSVPLTFKTLIFLPVLPFFVNWLGGKI